MFSKACEYAIKASIYIARQSLQQKRVNVKEVSQSIDAPVAFTAKILQVLCREDIMQSVRGQQGGFVFEEYKQREVKIFDIVRLIDGDGLFTQCGLGLQKCSADNPCPVHDDFKIVREKLIEMTQKHSLYDLALKTESGLAWLK
ncbi:Rrf2 family transcriptional regulator [Chryseobacterium sp. HSC-36S06]|uniref:RrF2 family transcriptional regulator n=1 Tax=Chryseobacterium sp. HSC-36S06 TaxID=2910970 RepID=UPI00209F9A1A|nr:Rrf2 family transcriptional regulator [Chryseobacterium sp. HSC-36S06]MCP2037878.1 Rrf2 family protein [Chryseobacterium sp. HSC-36S06]